MPSSSYRALTFLGPMPGRRFLAQVVVEWQAAGGHQRGDFFLEGGPDAVDFVELARGHDLGQVSLQLLNGTGGVVISVTAKRVFPLDLQQGPDFVQNGGDTFFFHGNTPVILPGDRTGTTASCGIIGKRQPPSQTPLPEMGDRVLV